MNRVLQFLSNHAILLRRRKPNQVKNCNELTGVFIGEKIQDRVVYTVDDNKDPIIFKDEKEAIEYLISCGVKQSIEENFVFLKERL